MKALGKQLVVEMWECERNINDPDALRKALQEGVDKAQATALSIQVHTFNPSGVSGVAVIAESHISVHTWPELDYAAVDVFTCGEKALPEAALDVLRDLFRPQRVDVLEIRRGIQV
ncbi:MAG: adenosylmethionine decarboxylase [Candidatus Bipolaricaulota bacterium]